MLTVVVATRTPAAAPGERLAGLSLAQRTVLTTQAQGATRVVLVTDAEDAELARLIAEDPRTRIPVTSRVRGAEESALGAALSVVDGPALLARHDLVVQPSVYAALFRASLGDEPALIAFGRAPGSAAGSAGVRGPLLVSPALARELEEDAASLDQALDRLGARRRLAPLEVPGWCQPLALPEDRRRALDALFEDCRKSVDGIVARHLNRHVSIFVSKRIVDTPITPNMMSAVTLSLGVLAGFAVARGAYWPTLIGAVLWQLNSILDGVDGELARVRFQHSRLGQWLDTISDDVTNVIFWAGLAVGARATPWLALSGWVAAGSNLVVALIYYAELIAIGSGDVYDIAWDLDKKPPSGWFGKVALACRYILKKDFFILFCLVVAVFGVLHYMLPVVGAFGFGLLVAAVARALRRARGPALRKPAA